MIRVKTMKQIATSAAIPGVRSLRSLGQRSHQLFYDQGRIWNSRFQMLASDDHRQWRNQIWSNRRDISQ